MLQGRPAFEVSKADDEWDDDAPTMDFSEERAEKRNEAEQKDLYDEKGYKHPPVTSITNVKSDIHEQYYELWVTIKNQSHRDIKLDKITLLGTRFELNYPLSAGEQRVFRAYRGNRLYHDHYKKAELYYHDVPTGDYFRADHVVHYRYHSDGMYEIVGLDLFLPIYDV